MTQYIIALAALALLLVWSAKDCERYRGNGYQPKGQNAQKPPSPPTTGSNAQRPKVIGTCINVDEDEKGVTFKILLAGDQTEHADKERQKSKTRHFAKSSTTHKKHSPIAATHSKKHGSVAPHNRHK